MSDAEIVRTLIEETLFMTIATADRSGKPWSSPVGFTYDDDYNFYWISAVDALHSQNIAARPEVALTIFGTSPVKGMDGVYIDGEAVMLTDPTEIQVGIDAFLSKRPQPPRFRAKSVDDVLDSSSWRMYRVKPRAIYKRIDGEQNGKAVTVRGKVQL